MNNCAKFLSIFVYTILIFFFQGHWLLGFAAVNIVAMIITKVAPPAALKHILAFLPFVLFVGIVNLAFGAFKNMSYSLYLSLRLILICNITQCYKKVVQAEDLANAIEIIFSPLKIFKIEGRDIGLMVCISLAFIPVLRRDFMQIRTALRARGMRLTMKNMQYLLKPFFIGILQRTGEIAKAIRTKGYEG
jgi:energy-coupling factor transporter transmembrane protein EcfT